VAVGVWWVAEREMKMKRERESSPQGTGHH
jgi:hypothetical protein